MTDIRGINAHEQRFERLKALERDLGQPELGRAALRAREKSNAKALNIIINLLEEVTHADRKINSERR